MKKKVSRDALEPFILEHKASLYRLAYSYMRDEQRAMDMVSEAIVTAYEKVASLKDPAGLKPWFHRILVRKCIDELRHDKKIIPMEDERFASIAVTEPGYDSIGDVLYHAVERLPEKNRTVIIMKYYEELTFEQIAEITGENVNTVKSRLYQGLEKLRRLPALKGATV